MNCQQVRDQFTDFLTGEITRERQSVVQSHLSLCSTCREELENLNQIWTKLGVLPEEEPGEQMRDHFYTMLESYKEALNDSRERAREGWLSRFFQGLRIGQPALQLTSIVAVLFIGLLAGIFITSNNQNRQSVQNLSREVENMRQIVAVSLLAKSSPSDRLQGIYWSSKIRRPDQKMMQVLFNTLNNDPNVNVRLSVVDTLYSFKQNSRVRQNLIRALPQQDSPLVQVALIDLLAETQDKKAIQPLRQIIKNPDTEPEVKSRARESIKQLNI